jgi:Protein of unknown function (DUF3313)
MVHLVAANVHGTPGAVKRAPHLPLMALALVTLVAACTKGDIIGGNTRQITEVQPTDGFLPQPDLLARNPGTLWDLTYIKPSLDIQAYHAIYLEPVALLTSPNSKLATLPADQRDKLANTFYSDVYNTVSKSCHVASVPGPSVLRFHIALSDASSSNGVTKTLATYVPYVNIAYKAGSLAFNQGVGYFSGTTTAEAYATDGVTQEVVWQGVDKRGGNTSLLQDTTDKWLDVHHAFQAWASQLVTRLQATGICPQTQTSRSTT